MVVWNIIFLLFFTITLGEDDAIWGEDDAIWLAICFKLGGKKHQLEKVQNSQLIDFQSQLGMCLNLHVRNDY